MDIVPHIDSSEAEFEPPTPRKFQKSLKSWNRLVADIFVVSWFLLTIWLSLQMSQFWRIVGFTCVFFGVNKINPIITRYYWEGYDRMKKRDREKWVNISVSLVHSIISGAYCIWTVWRAWNEFTSANADWVSPPKSRAPLWTVSVSVGYFAYDTWDMIQCGMVLTSPSLLIHHAILLSCLIVGLWYEVGLLYVVLCFLCEVNSIFLHTRTLLNTYIKYGTKYDDTSTATISNSKTSTTDNQNNILTQNGFNDKGIRSRKQPISEMDTTKQPISEMDTTKNVGPDIQEKPKLSTKLQQLRRNNWTLLFATMYSFRTPVHFLLVPKLIMDRWLWPNDGLLVTATSAMITFNFLNYNLAQQLHRAYKREIHA